MKVNYLLAFFALCFSFSAYSQPIGDVPVYPNAKINVAVEGGGRPSDCAFSTTDPLSAVVKFYEGVFRTKALDIPSLINRYPQMKAQYQEMQSQMPPGFLFRALVLSEINYQGVVTPNFFQILSAGGKTEFSLTYEQLGKSGARFGFEFRKATGSMDDIDKQYDEWLLTHPAAQQKQFDLPLYPGALLGFFTNDETNVDPADNAVHASSCSDVTFYVPDTLAFDKVVEFYRTKLHSSFKETEPPGSSGPSFGMENKQFIREPILDNGGQLIKTVIHGKNGDVNRYLVIQFENAVPTHPFYDKESGRRVPGVPAKCISINYRSEVLDGTCVKFE
jgi:hypothetical protein